MTQDDLLNRLSRIYSAVSATMEFDMTNLPAKVSQTGSSTVILQDFMGSLNEHDIANLAQSVIHNIAINSLQDHLKKWARATGKRTPPSFNQLSTILLILKSSAIYGTSTNMEGIGAMVDTRGSLLGWREFAARWFFQHKRRLGHLSA